MSGFRAAAAIGALVGLIGVTTALVPPMRQFEDTLVLPALFHLRGPVPPPPDVVVVTMDERSAAVLGFGVPQREWPRRTHAMLVSRLVERGAAAIAFDVEFFRASPDRLDDTLFATAMRDARRVVLVERVESLKVGARQVWQRQQPVAVLRDAAVAAVPAPLPDLPVVTWTWLFLPTPQGHSASLAVAALQTAATARGAASPIRWTRALASLKAAAPTAYLNLYGPPRSVCSISYSDVIRPSGAGRCSIDGAIVFVGAGDSGAGRAGLPDTYHTAYGGAEGVDFSGVELHATALANLLDGSLLRVLPASFVVLVVWGLLLGGGVCVLRCGAAGLEFASRTGAVTSVAVASGLYVAAAFVCFAHLHLLIPVAVPIAVQAPVVMLVALLLRARASREDVLAVCLATDAAGSTELGERMPHDQYAQLMNDYNVTLSAAVRARSGEVLDPQGDGFIAIWRCAQGQTRGARLQACLAALDLLDAAEAFNRKAAAGAGLPTRVALTIGTITVHSDADRGLFQAYGGALNIAARLRDLNVLLGTRLIASTDVVTDLGECINVKSLTHSYSIKGIARPPAIVEVARVASASMERPGVV